MSKSYIKDLLTATVLLLTVSLAYLEGDYSGTSRTLTQDGHRIAFLQGILSQTCDKYKTHALVTNSAVNYLEDQVSTLKEERDDAVKKLNDLEEKLWHYADGSCMISAAARGAEFRLSHTGLWNKHLLIGFYIIQVDPSGRVVQTAVGHAVFIFEDSDSIMWCYSNGGSYKLGKNVKHDAFTIAYLLYGSRVISAEFE